MKKNHIVILVCVIIILTILGYAAYFPRENITKERDARNQSYTIAGQVVTLKNGVSEVEVAPGSASKITTRYFGNEAHGDLNDDGRDDTVFIATENTGGSGTFYYVFASMSRDDSYVGSEGLLLGDRIAPQSVTIGTGENPHLIIVNYADRKPGESFATPPSVGKSIQLLLDPETMHFGEVIQNFEGEADPERMSLTQKTWKWDNVTYGDGTVIRPQDPSKFVLTFRGPKTFSATTDCNGVGGEYVATESTIYFTKMMSTLMFCEGSQEAAFSKALSEVQSYFFTSKGELVFDLKFDSGSMVFR